MGFLIRSAFWLSLVMLVIPIAPPEAEPGVEAGMVGPIEALGAARTAIGDVSAFCDRNPDTCETGKAALHTVAVRARESARIAYQMLDAHLEPDTSISTGGIELDTPAEPLSR